MAKKIQYKFSFDSESISYSPCIDTKASINDEVQKLKHLGEPDRLKYMAKAMVDAAKANERADALLQFVAMLLNGYNEIQKQLEESNSSTQKK